MKYHFADRHEPDVRRIGGDMAVEVIPEKDVPRRAGFGPQFSDTCPLTRSQRNVDLHRFSVQLRAGFADQLLALVLAAVVPDIQVHSPGPGQFVGPEHFFVHTHRTHGRFFETAGRRFPTLHLQRNHVSVEFTRRRTRGNDVLHCHSQQNQSECHGHAASRCRPHRQTGLTHSRVRRLLTNQ